MQLLSIYKLLSTKNRLYTINFMLTHTYCFVEIVLNEEKNWVLRYFLTLLSITWKKKVAHSRI